MLNYNFMKEDSNEYIYKYRFFIKS